MRERAMAVSSGLSSRRQARLQQDIQSITALCSANPVLQVFTPPTSESLVVLLNGPTHSRFMVATIIMRVFSRAEYTFTFTEDYPENTIVVCSQEADNVVVISKPLTIAVWEICAENGVSLFSGSSDRLWHDGGGIVPGHEGGGMVPGHEGGEMGPGHEGGEMGPGHEGGGTVEMEEDAHPHSEDTPLSLGTQVSVTSSECLDEEFYEDYDCYDPDMTEENVVHPLLERELDLVQAVYGQNALETRIHGGIDEMDIFINIDLNTFLDEHMASAWGVNESQPLIILLHILSISKYLEGLEPKVNVFQVKDDVAPTASAYDASTKRRKIGISSQLEKILQAFVSKQWRKISVSTVERAMSGETHSSKTPETRHMVDPREDAKLAKLVEMGFRAEEAREALHQCRGDVEAACELLATTPSAASSSGGGSGFLSSLVSFLPGYMRQDSMGAQLEVTEHHDPE
ncbi:Protein mono-ADP-ribosyltransferase PARP8, partial [Geodia barretti]